MKQSRNETVEQIANGLGWFSLALGAAEILMPDQLARFIGAPEGPKTRAVMRAYGAREIAAGVGILAMARPAGWLWARVAGDGVDLATLGYAMKRNDSSSTKVGAAIAAVAGVTALDILTGAWLTGTSSPGTSRSEARGAGQGRISASGTVLINRDPSDVYEYFHNFENLPNFMRHLDSVTVRGKRSHWKAKGPAGMKVEWDAETIEDRPNSLIRWRSTADADVANSGTVRFDRAPGNRGTYMRVDLNYDPPGGGVGALFAKLFGKDADQQLYDDLRWLKQILEVGEIVNSDASIHKGMHAARPPKKVPTDLLHA